MLSEEIRHINRAAGHAYRQWGPGWPPSTYLDAMCWELRGHGYCFQRGCPLPGSGRLPLLLRGGYVDLLVEREIAVELRTVPRLTMVHRSQVRQMMRAGGWERGVLINFPSIQGESTPTTCTLGLTTALSEQGCG